MAATKEILRIAFEELGLKRVYLNVLAENKRATAFYQKVGFKSDTCIESRIQIDGKEKSLNWYFTTR